MALSGDNKVPPEISRKAADQTLPLGHVDAAHVYAIVKTTLEKLALVGSITVDPQQQAQELTQSVGEEITRMISSQKELEFRFEELVGAQHTLRHLPNKSKLRENQAELQQVAEALRQSTKQLCRNLKDNPNVAENMLKVASERQALQLLLSNCLTEVEMLRKVQPVVENVMAQEAAEVLMRATIEHERTTATAVKSLRNDLRDEKVDHEDKMREKKKTLLVLKDELKQVKMDTAISTRYEAKASLALNDHSRRLESTSLEDLRAMLASVRQKIEMEKDVHRTTAEFMKKLSTKLQEKSSDWSVRRDVDLSNQERDLEHLRIQMQKDSARLREMEDKHRHELDLKQERENEATDEKERLDFEGMRAERRARAAVLIQAAWRGHAVRKALKGGGKKAGGKKGAAKKGKK